MNTKTFIFDLDGVIVDTAKYHFLAWQRLAAQIGIEFTPEHNEQLKGVSRVRSLEIILGLGNIEASQEEKNQWLIQKNTEYLSYIEKMDESEILPGVMQVLNYLKEKALYNFSRFFFIHFASNLIRKDYLILIFAGTFV